jgi:hypothetical protein
MSVLPSLTDTSLFHGSQVSVYWLVARPRLVRHGCHVAHRIVARGHRAYRGGTDHGDFVGRVLGPALVVGRGGAGVALPIAGRVVAQILLLIHGGHRVIGRGAGQLSALMLGHLVKPVVQVVVVLGKDAHRVGQGVIAPDDSAHPIAPVLAVDLFGRPGLPDRLHQPPEPVEPRVFVARIPGAAVLIGQLKAAGPIVGDLDKGVEAKVAVGAKIGAALLQRIGPA